MKIRLISLEVILVLSFVAIILGPGFGFLLGFDNPYYSIPYVNMGESAGSDGIIFTIFASLGFITTIFGIVDHEKNEEGLLFTSMFTSGVLFLLAVIFFDIFSDNEFITTVNGNEYMGEAFPLTVHIIFLCSIISLGTAYSIKLHCTSSTVSLIVLALLVIIARFGIVFDNSVERYLGDNIYTILGEINDPSRLLIIYADLIALAIILLITGLIFNYSPLNQYFKVFIIICGVVIILASMIAAIYYGFDFGVLTISFVLVFICGIATTTVGVLNYKEIL